MRRPSIERRLRDVVWMVLAGASCKPAEQPVTIDLATAIASAAATSPAVTTSVVATGPSATVATTASTTPPPTLTATPPPRDPNQLCKSYRLRRETLGTLPAKAPKNAVVKTRRSSQVPPPDVSVVRLEDDAVWCQIVWHRERSKKQIMVAPVCCQQSAGSCGGAVPEQVDVERLTVETVRVRDGGEADKSSVGAATWEQEEPPRHHCGRRTEGCAARSAEPTYDVGAALADMAALEAVAVHAFARLEAELAALGAPASLLRRAQRARRDEIRHTRVMARHARRHGGALSRVKRPRFAARSRLALAIENAVEGCVFETYGALVATFQAERCADPALRAAFTQIAADERAHAALAWDVRAWLDATLSPEERTLVAAETDAALARLRAMASRAVPSADRALGAPSPVEARALVELCFAA